MTPDKWHAGMLALAAAFPDRDELPEVKAARSRIYRATLGDLSDEAWTHAVTEAVKNERWFPTVKALRDYAAGAPSPRAALPAPRSPEQVEQDREAARQSIREGLDRIARETGLPLPTSRPGLTRAIEARPIQDSDERREELRRQAAEITQEG